MDFDPNSKQPPAIEWATYIPNRKPNFKTHKNRGQALNAFQYRDNVILYKYDFDQSKWIEIYRIENWSQNASHCEMCGIEFGSRNYTYPNSEWWRDEKRKIVEPLKRMRICSGCRSARYLNGKIFRFEGSMPQDSVKLSSIEDNEVQVISRQEYWRLKKVF